MRQVWLALASAQHQAGLVSAEQCADLQSQVDNVDIERALEIEKETRHDVMAEIRTYAEQCSVGGGIIHWGATSADKSFTIGITDYLDVIDADRAALQTHRGELQLTGQRLNAVVQLIKALGGGWGEGQALAVRGGE
jgi:adenylosuccinate lyase